MAKGGLAIYGLGVLVLFALLFVIYYYRQSISGFTDVTRVQEQFQSMDAGQKMQICKTFSEQLNDVLTKQKTANPTDAAGYAEAVKGLTGQLQSIGCSM
jgi:hypothetical protein